MQFNFFFLALLLCLEIRVSLTANLQKVLSEVSDSSQVTFQIPLKNVRNTQFLGQLEIGEGLHTFSMLFDTGSSDSWVYSDKCHLCKNGFDGYSCTKTCSYENQKEKYYLSYGGGEVSGFYIKDTIRIQSATLKNQQFLLVTDTVQRDKLEGSGIIGLAPNSEFLRNLMESNVLKAKVFTIYLSRSLNSYNSLISFGEISQKIAAQSVEYFKVLSNEQWVINLDQIQMGDRTLNVEKSKALIDSGTSGFVLLFDQFQAFFQLLIEKHNKNCKSYLFYIQCACPQGISGMFPSLTFSFQKNSSFSMNAEDYILEEVGVCTLLVGTLGTSQKYVVLGNLLMKKFYTIYDLEKNRIGLAPVNETRILGKKDVKVSMNLVALFIGSLFLGILLIYVMRKVSGLGNIQEQNKQ